MRFFSADTHIIILILIMLVCGVFGGLLNYLHNFDTTENEKQDNITRNKYILLGIAASFVVPVFLKMIASGLIENPDSSNNNYLVFAGFCLIAAIFSKRFITTIGDKILEAAKKAEKVALESKQKSENTQLELTSTKQRIEDVKLAVDINNSETRSANYEIRTTENTDERPKQLLIELASTYVKNTSVPNYSERLMLKAELGRKMGGIIVQNNLPKEELLAANKTEGMLLALAYSIQLRPDKDGLLILNKLSKIASQLYTKYSILVSYDTLARNNLITRESVQEVYNLIVNFKSNADGALIKKIEDTINILSIVDPAMTGYKINNIG